MIPGIVYKIVQHPSEMRADKAFPGTKGVSFQVNTNKTMQGYTRFVSYQNLEYYTQYGAQIED